MFRNVFTFFSSTVRILSNFQFLWNTPLKGPKSNTKWYFQRCKGNKRQAKMIEIKVKTQKKQKQMSNEPPIHTWPDHNPNPNSWCFLVQIGPEFINITTDIALKDLPRQKQTSFRMMRIAGRIRMVKVGQICLHWSANLEWGLRALENEDQITLTRYLRSEQQHDQPRPLSACSVTQPWRREGPSALCGGSRTVKNPAATDNINVEMSLDGLYHRPSGPKRNNMDKKKKTEHITASRLVSLRWHQNAAEISSFPKTILNHATFKAV